MPAMPESQLTEIKKAFALIDLDGDGFITGDEYRLVMRSLGRHPTDEEVRARIAAVDRDGDGRVSLAEFVRSYEENPEAAKG